MARKSSDLNRVRALTELTLSKGLSWELQSLSDGERLVLGSGTGTQTAVLDRDPATSEIRLRVSDRNSSGFDVVIRQALSVAQGLVEEYELNSALALLWQAAERSAPEPEDALDRLINRIQEGGDQAER